MAGDGLTPQRSSLPISSARLDPGFTGLTLFASQVATNHHQLSGMNDSSAPAVRTVDALPVQAFQLPALGDAYLFDSIVLSLGLGLTFAAALTGYAELTPGGLGGPEYKLPLSLVIGGAPVWGTMITFENLTANPTGPPTEIGATAKIFEQFYEPVRWRGTEKIYLQAEFYNPTAQVMSLGQLWLQVATFDMNPSSPIVNMTPGMGVSALNYTLEKGW